MSILRDILGRHSKKAGARRGAPASASSRVRASVSAPFSAPASAQAAGPLPGPQEGDARPAFVVDDTVIALHRALADLKGLEVPRAAKERGWVALQRELELRPIRPPAAVAREARRGRTRRLQWALGAAAAVMVVTVASVAGVLSVGPTQTADTGDGPPTVTTVAGPGATPHYTTGVTDDPGRTTITTPTTGGEGPGAGPGSGATEGTVPETGPGGPSAPSATTGTTTAPPSGGITTTTVPAPQGTTPEQGYAAAQRIGTARAAALFLAELAVTGNTSGARAIVAPQAESSLVLMMASLEQPYGYSFTGAEAEGPDTVRVTFTISDRVVDGRGELVETVKPFAVRVKVDDAGAIITAISAGA